MTIKDVLSKAKYLVEAYGDDELDIDAVTEAEKELPYDVVKLLSSSYPNHIVCDVNHPEYDEAHALQNLLVAIYEAEKDQEEHLEHANEVNVDYGQFAINIAGKSIAFMLGGPQVEALYAFVEHICGENLYSIDRAYNTVKGWKDK